MKLTAQLGQEAYRWILKHGIQDAKLLKLSEQIQKLDSRIQQMDEKVSGITNDLSQHLNAEVGNDVPVRRRPFRKKRNKS